MLRRRCIALASSLAVAGILLGVAAGPARAENIGITARRLRVVDKLEFASVAGVRFLSIDPRIRKGSGLSAAEIGATMDITIEAFHQEPMAGAFSIPKGFSTSKSGWRVSSGVAKYINSSAPLGPTQVRVATVQSNRFIKVLAKGLGDLPIDLDDLRFAPFHVQVRFVVLNGTETITHCTLFRNESCVIPPAGAGTGRKLECVDGEAVSDCAFPPLPLP